MLAMSLHAAIPAQVSQDTRLEITNGVEKLKEATGITPGLAAILVGEDPASEIYVRNKRKACTNCGMYSEEHKLPTETTEEELLDLVNKLNSLVWNCFSCVDGTALLD